MYIFFIVISLVLYEKVWRNRVCRKKIRKYIENSNGEVLNIERVTPRDEIFVVSYKRNEKVEERTVKFSIFYSEYWY